MVWLVTGLHVALMAAYSLLYLQYTGPDEPFHHDMAIAWHQGDGLAAPGERWMVAGVGGGFLEIEDAYIDRNLSERAVTPRSERPSYEELGGDSRYQGYPYPNQMTQHPPLYYATLGGLLFVLPGEEGWAWDQVTALLRIVNIAMVAPLPLLAWAAARPLTQSPVVPSIAATTPLLFPGLTRSGASINNDNLLILLGGVLAVLLVRVCLGDRRLRMAIGVGVITGLALFTKGLALAFPPAVLGAYLVGWRRAPDRPPWRAASAALITAFLFGGWWWVHNVLRFGVVQPAGVGPEALAQIRGPKAPESVTRDILEFVEGFAELVVRRSVATLGLLEPPHFPFVLSLLILVVLAVGVLAAVIARKRSVAAPGVVTVVLIPLVGIGLIMMYGTFDTWKWNLTFPGIQGRYFYPGLVGLTVVAASGWSALAPRARRFLPLGGLALAGVAHTMAAKRIVSWQWLPASSGGTRIDEPQVALAAIARWSPWPIGLTMVPFIAIVIFAVASAAVAIRFARSVDRAPARSDRNEPSAEKSSG